MAGLLFNFAELEKEAPGLTKRIGELVLNGTEEFCPKLDDASCDYLMDAYESKLLTERQINQYQNVVCEKLCSACKLNLK